jgi:mannose-6-phosphate isomerase-like protein (cupin superfamily)
MSLAPGEEIPLETHRDTDQFIRVESGVAQVTVDGATYTLKEDEIIVIPAGSSHRVTNASVDESLKLYTLYAPFEHASGTVHRTQKEADAAHHSS